MSKRKPTVEHDVFHLTVRPQYELYCVNEIQGLIGRVLKHPSIKRFFIVEEDLTHIHCCYVTDKKRSIPQQKYFWRSLYEMAEEFGWGKSAIKLIHHGDENYLLGYLQKTDCSTVLDQKGQDPFHLADCLEKFETGISDKPYMGKTKKQDFKERKYTMDQLADMYVEFLLEKKITSYTQIELHHDSWLTTVVKKVNYQTYQKINTDKFLDYVRVRLNAEKNFILKKKSNPIYIPECPSESALLEGLVFEDGGRKLSDQESQT